MRASVSLVGDGGASEVVAVDTAIPAADLDAQERRLRGKFDALAVPVLGEARAKALADAIGGLDAMPSAAALTALLRAA